jgi:hypothetical protein
MNSKINKETPKGNNDIIPVIEEWVRFTGFFNDIPGISLAIQIFNS